MKNFYFFLLSCSQFNVADFLFNQGVNKEDIPVVLIGSATASSIFLIALLLWAFLLTAERFSEWLDTYCDVWRFCCFFPSDCCLSWLNVDHKQYSEQVPEYCPGPEGLLSAADLQCTTLSSHTERKAEQTETPSHTAEDSSRCSLND